MHLYCKPLHMKTKIKGFCFLCNAMMTKKKLNSAVSLTFKLPVKRFPKPRKKVEMLPVLKNKVMTVLNGEMSPFLNITSIMCLKEFFTLKNNFDTFYSFVIDVSVAKDIVNKILQHKNENSTIIEGNAGLGLITHQLVSSGVPEIHIFDNHSDLKILCLEKLLMRFSQQLKITNLNFFYPSYSFSKESSSTVELLKLESHKTVIGVVQNYSFFSHLVYKILVYCLWHCIYSTEWFVVVNQTTINCLLHFSGGSYTTYCVINLLFQLEIIAEYPAEAFLPLTKNNKNMFLLKISRKPIMFENLTEEDIQDFTFLIRIIARSRHNFIIPTLEKWIPDCGPYLISKGISLSFQTCDLLPSEAVQLFKFLKECDRYNSFKTLIREFNKDIKIK